MSENPIAISMLNDFIFCPASIYFHSLENEDVLLFQDTFQLSNTCKIHKYGYARNEDAELLIVK